MNPESFIKVFTEVNVYNPSTQTQIIDIINGIKNYLEKNKTFANENNHRESILQLLKLCAIASKQLKNKEEKNLQVKLRIIRYLAHNFCDANRYF